MTGQEAGQIVAWANEGGVPMLMENDRKNADINEVRADD